MAVQNELQASLAGQSNRDRLHELRRLVDAQSGLSVARSVPSKKPVLVAWEYVASAVSHVAAYSVVASLAAYLLVSAAASVAACVVSSPASLPAYSVALAAGFLVPHDALAPSCASCCTPYAAAVNLKLRQYRILLNSASFFRTSVTNRWFLP